MAVSQRLTGALCVCVVVVFPLPVVAKRRLQLAPTPAAVTTGKSKTAVAAAAARQPCWRSASDALSSVRNAPVAAGPAAPAVVLPAAAGRLTGLGSPQQQVAATRKP